MFIASTLAGLEEICCKEVNGKKIIGCRVKFEKKQDVRSALVVYEFIDGFKFKTLGNILSKVRKLKIPIKGRFKVECNREGKHKFSSQEVKEDVGEVFYNKKFKVDLHNPGTIIYIDIVNNNCFIGLNPENAGKRKYRIRGSRQGLNATIAYALLKIADYKREDVLLDPFCGDGVILIEAGLLGGKNLHGTSDYLENAKINSHLAGVKINLDNNFDFNKFKKGSVDKIITNPLMVEKAKIREVFAQAKRILKKEGVILIISNQINSIKKIAGENGFNGRKKAEIVNGDIHYTVMGFKSD